MQKTIGGDRLGSGKKMKVDLHGYERSTHNMGYVWRSTMAAGTLVPFLSEIALPGDTFDINLDCDIKTHPTIGPLFGSYKVQLDIFQAPVRLYQAQLHNNKLGIGLNMASIKLPQMTLYADSANTIDEDAPDNSQINPSSILSYLNIRGIGVPDTVEGGVQERMFNALPYLSYVDVYKNYYANKQEEIGYVIHKVPDAAFTENVTGVLVAGNALPQAPGVHIYSIDTNGIVITINWTGTAQPLYSVIFNTDQGYIAASDIADSISVGAGSTVFYWDFSKTGYIEIKNWDYLNSENKPVTPPVPYQFNLSDIDNMREVILQNVPSTTPLDITEIDLNPYQLLLQNGANQYLNTQEGLLLKTYQSDLFNNWLSTEWIDGTGGINEITAIDTSGGSFNIDTLNLSKKVYDMLNRIAVSGGTYDDWLDAVYTHDRYVKSSTPVYMGGLIKELVFQEVVSNSESANGQPLGTLAGKGTMAKKHKGGAVTIKVDEPSYIIGIISLTPRVDYSQGNKWDVNLQTMDDLHKPALDEIGFQELITEQMAWWSTARTSGNWVQKSAGKQPAWINYMTNVNQTRGNFAIPDNEMFMTLNRRYEMASNQIDDLTTYIDPSKFNFIFAETAIDAQNFWAQIAVDITARRKMSAKLMPNL